MSRTIQVELFKFSELSDKAKQRAMDWWRNCESQDSAWIGEHNDSMSAAIQSLERLYDLEGEEALAEWRKIIAESLECKWTGYCDDGILRDCADPSRIPHACDVANWYEDAWQKECDWMNKDAQVIENIEANDYEFYANGDIA